MNTAQPQPTPGADSDSELNALTNQLTQIAEKAPSHRLMLLALLSTYKAVAVVHPCCTHFAAKAALQVGGDLLVRSLNTQATGPIH